MSDAATARAPKCQACPRKALPSFYCKPCDLTLCDRCSLRHEEHRFRAHRASGCLLALAFLALLSAFLALPGCGTPATVRTAIAGNADTAEWLRDELVPVLEGSKPLDELTADERAALASVLIANAWRARELQEWADDVPLEEPSQEKPE